MNRTLKRPMFRMGGAAEGITSGLDRKPLARVLIHTIELLKLLIDLKQIWIDTKANKHL
jgi:hypothetical protein